MLLSGKTFHASKENATLSAVGRMNDGQGCLPRSRFKLYFVAGDQ